MASSAGGQLKRANFFLSQRDAVMKVNGSVSQRPDSGSGSLRFTNISRQPFFLSVTQLLRVPDSLQQLLKDLCVAFNKSILAICTAEGGRVLDVDLIRYGRAFCPFACSWCTSCPFVVPGLSRAWTYVGTTTFCGWWRRRERRVSQRLWGSGLQSTATAVQDPCLWMLLT